MLAKFVKEYFVMYHYYTIFDMLEVDFKLNIKFKEKCLYFFLLTIETFF